MITGIVRGRDGKPVAGAEVTLRNSDKPSTTKTGPDGRYRFGGQDKPDAVVVVHESGFAVWPYDEDAASFDVTLAPWSRIEGVLKVGKNLAPNHKVCAWQNSACTAGSGTRPRPTSAPGSSSSESDPARSPYVELWTSRTMRAGFPRTRSSRTCSQARLFALWSAASVDRSPAG